MAYFYKFPDGSTIEQDPRQEDPLIYYRPVSGSSIGFDIEPTYALNTTHTAVIRVFDSHVGRLQSLSNQEICTILEGLITGVSRRYKNWKSISFEWPEWLVGVVDEKAQAEWMERAGWEAAPQQGWQQKWNRIPD